MINRIIKVGSNNSTIININRCTIDKCTVNVYDVIQFSDNVGYFGVEASTYFGVEASTYRIVIVFHVVGYPFVRRGGLGSFIPVEPRHIFMPGLS